MENTPKSQNATDAGGYLDSSRFRLENSANIGQSTPLSCIPRKRKLCHVDSLPSPPNTPQFSSTLNESVMENLENFHLHNDNDSRYLSKGM